MDKLLFVLMFFLVSIRACGQEQEKLFPSDPERLGQPEVFHLNTIPRWLEFDGELRARLENHAAINDQSGNGTSYLLTRVRPGMRLTPDKHLTFYLQFHDTHALGLPLRQTSSNMRDTFDLRQGYVGLRAGSAELVIGRQELKFGSERLVGVSDFANNARSFDGFDLGIGQTNRLDLFTTSVVAIHPTSLDTHGAGLTFHGAYAQLKTILPSVNVKPFLLVSTKKGITDGFGHLGSLLEFTSGAEVSGRVGRYFDIDGLVALQRGTYASESIRALAGFIKAAYILPVKAWSSRIGLEYDRASGDDQAHPGQRAGFDQLYPSNHDAFGLVDLFAFQNITQKRLNLDINPTKPLNILVQAGRLDLATAHDAVYASNGAVFKTAPANGFPSTQLGYEADISMKYLYRDDLVISAGFGQIFPTSTTVARTSFAYLSLTYRFLIKH